MRLTIRYQLLLPLLALMLGVVVLSGWIAWLAAERARQQIEAQLDGVAKTVTSVTFPRNLQTLNLMKSLSGAEFLLCDRQGQPLLIDGQALTTLPTLPSELPPPGPRDRLHLAPRVHVAGVAYLCQGTALLPEVGANLSVYFFYPEARLHEAVSQAVWPALIVGSIGGTISIGLTLLATQRIIARLRDLVRRTRVIAAGDFSTMPLPAGHDELRDLGQAINDMAERLARYQETLRASERLRLLGQVSGGLAHQLRNGVAGAKLAIQLHTRTAPQSEELQVALRQLALVEIQLRRFLDLGKAMELQRQPCDLAALVDESLALLRPSCAHAHIEVLWNLPPSPVQLSADPHLLGQVLLNLITNAMEAAGPNGRIEMRVGAAGVRAFAEVHDSGAGPEPSLAARLFEPFVTGKPEGVGLGLAVAKQIVETHGGTIRWERRDGSTCFRIEIPHGSMA